MIWMNGLKMNLIDGPRVWRRDIAMAIEWDENERDCLVANPNEEEEQIKRMHDKILALCN